MNISISFNQGKLNATNLKQIVKQGVKVGKANFNVKGIGSVPNLVDIEYFGFIATMLPSDFLRLAKRIGPGRNAGTIRMFQEAIPQGQEIAMPFLKFSLHEGKMYIIGHEGRHRCMALQNLQKNEPIPVALFSGEGDRARDITKDTLKNLNKIMVSQDGDPVEAVIRHVYHTNFDMPISV